MTKEDYLKQLSEVLLNLIRLENLVEDSFFLEKIKSRTQLIATLGLIVGEENPNNVAQYRDSCNGLIFNLDWTIELIGIMENFKLISPSAFIYNFEKEFLALNLEVIRRKNKAREYDNKIQKENQDTNFEKLTTPERKSKKQTREKTEMSDNKKRILNYIKSYPNSRTRDIINEFSAISDRTVKRNLMELMEGGFIKKRVDNKAVYYTKID